MQGITRYEVFGVQKMTGANFMIWWDMQKPKSPFAESGHAETQESSCIASGEAFFYFTEPTFIY